MRYAARYAAIYSVLFVVQCTAHVFLPNALAQDVPVPPGLESARPTTETTINSQELDRANQEFFESRIRPVLIEHCYECHSGQSKIVQGNLRLD
ncbi:MAG: hypothetical protein ACK5PZ_08365, partial [Pirellula sp.]